MKQALSNRTGDTVRIQRPPPKVFTDPIGRNVWMSGIDPCDLELEADSSADTNPYDSVGREFM